MSYLCRRRLMLGGLAAIAAPVAGPLLAQESGHAQLLAALSAADALDPYLSEGLAEIVGALGRALRVPGGAALNAVPGEDGIMVCVLRAEREVRPLPPDVVLPPGLSGTPMSDPARRVVWIDADFLRTLAVRISLRANKAWGGGGLTAVAAVAGSMLAPPPALPELWDPRSSPALRHQTLILASRGAAGFLLAHEMAHILLGEPPAPDPVREGLPRRARQLAPMCPTLTEPSVTARHAYEDRADAIALEAVLAAGPAVGLAPVGLPGELGIAILFLLMLASDIVRVASTVERPLAQRYLQMEVGAEAFDRLRELWTPLPGTDLVRLFYTDQHPAAVQRLLGVMHDLAQRPASMWYGMRDPAADQALLLRLVEQVCDEALRDLTGG